MAKASTVTINLSITGDGINEQDTPVLAQDANAVGVRAPTAFPAGDATVPNPSATKTVRLLFVPPAGSTVVKILKGASGDTGVTLAAAADFMVTLPAGGSVILNCSAPETITVWKL